jgi:integrase
MPSLFRRASSDAWYAEFYEVRRTPAKRRFSLRTSNKREAQRLLVRLEDQYVRGEFDPWIDCDWTKERKKVKRVSLKEAFDSFIASKQGLSPNTIEHYHFSLRPLIDHVGPSKPTFDLTPTVILEWIASKEVCLQSKHSYLSRVGIFTRYLVSEGLLESDVSKKVKLSKAADKLASKLITGDMLEQILKKTKSPGIPSYIAPATILAYELAMRSGEVTAMRASWVDLERGIVLVQPGQGFSPPPPPARFELLLPGAVDPLCP